MKATNIFTALLILMALALTAPAGRHGTAAAADPQASEYYETAQYDPEDIAPPPVPDTPEAPGPGEIQDDALSPDSVIDDPDPPIDETEPYMMDPYEEGGDEGQYYPDAGWDEYDEEGYYSDDSLLLVEQEDPLVDREYPLVDSPEYPLQHPYPLVTQEQPLVDMPDPLVAQEYPLVRQPAPLVARPNPLVNKPYPLVQRPAPVVPQQNPVVRMPSPVVKMPEPLAR